MPVRTVYPERAADPRTVLVLPYGTGVGDLALQRGIIAAIVRRFPQARLNVYAPRSAAALLPPGVEVVPRILGIPAWERVRGTERWLARLGPLEAPAIGAAFRLLPPQTLARLPARALQERYDRVVDLLGAFLGGSDFGRDWLPSPDDAPARHVVDILRDYLAAHDIAVSPEDCLLPLPVSADDTAWADTALGSAAEGCPRILLNPHAGSRLKLPGDGFWHEAARALRAAGVAPVIVSGGSQAEERTARELAAHGGVLLPRTSFSRLVAAGRRCALTLSPDTGLLHLLALDGQRWVGLFGSTNPAFGGPYDRSRGTVVVSNAPRSEACRTCWQRFTVGSACCPVFPGSSCLSTLDPRAVVRTVIEQVCATAGGRA